MILTLLGIPISILPEIKDTCGDFGAAAKDIFGSEIPIVSIIADHLAKCHCLLLELRRHASVTRSRNIPYRQYG